MIRRASIALGCLWMLLAWCVWAQVAVPELSRRVTDLTGTLGADQIVALENRLAEFETRTGSQIAVLMVPTTEPEDIAQFAIRVADQWKIGRKKIDDGVILIVAKDDRELRIEVGYGLEGAIPDAVAKRVIAEIITPYFKRGEFSAGIDAGVGQLMRLIDGESLPAPPPAARSGADGSGESLLIIVVLGFFIGSFFSSLMGRGLASSIAGAGVAGIAWISMGAWLSPLLMGLGVFFAVLLFGGRTWGSGGGWSSGGGMGGGSWGGGSGSWGGGGGGFGGGGASGSW